MVQSVVTMFIDAKTPVYSKRSKNGLKSALLDTSRPLFFVQIDAALDIHKVRRVASMLADRASSGGGQCIVISHRPEMQEKGR